MHLCFQLQNQTSRFICHILFLTLQPLFQKSPKTICVRVCYCCSLNLRSETTVWKTSKIVFNAETEKLNNIDLAQRTHDKKIIDLQQAPEGRLSTRIIIKVVRAFGGR